MGNSLKHSNLCVIESRWWQSRNTSVRGMFELLSDLHTGSHHGYEYEMVNSRTGFQESVGRLLQYERCNYLYIATHGEESGLAMFNDDGISRAVIRNLLKKHQEERNLVGLYLGSCSFLQPELVEFLYEEDISPWWIAGYSRKIDWIDSTALDFLCFNKILSEERNLSDNPVKLIRKVAKQLSAECGGLIRKLGFQIYLCEQHPKIDELLNCGE
ncbi:MAG: hypothetical protein ACLPID_10945 [Beijerinckiaceae bacterium]